MLQVLGIGALGRSVAGNGSVITTKDGQKIDVQTLSALTRPPEAVEGDIKVTSIDARQLASGQVIHIPTAQSTQPAVQPITIAGLYLNIFMIFFLRRDVQTFYIFQEHKRNS